MKEKRRSGWIKKHYGISRKTLELYEKKGYIHPRTDEEENRHRNKIYKDYSMEDIKSAWEIKTLIDIGYSHKDIQTMLEQNDYVNIRESISEKIDSLKEKQRRMEHLLKYAESIRRYGFLPAFPKDEGGALFNEHIESMRSVMEKTQEDDEAISKLTALLEKSTESDQADYQASIYEEVAGKPIGEWNYGDIQAVSCTMEFNTNLQLCCVLLSRLTERPVNDELVQLIVKHLYIHTMLNKVPGMPDQITPEWFGTHIPAYIYGSEMTLWIENLIGKENCKYAAMAVTYFGEKNS